MSNISYEDLSINIVNTPGYGSELKDNPVLLAQLDELMNLGVNVNILMNGNTENEISARKNLRVKKIPERVVLGKARYILHDFTETTWYINIDEDDSFMPIQSWIHDLIRSLELVNTATAFYKYQVVWADKTQTLPENTNKLMCNSPIDPKYTQVNCGAIYNKTRLGKRFCRPYMNLSEDDIFYMYLCSEYKFTTFINLEIQRYNRTLSTMSKDSYDKDKYDSNDPLTIVTEFGYYGFRMILVKIIQP